MNNPKLLIFLHGFGFDKTNNQDSIQNLCQGLKVDYFTFDGPYDSQRARGGYSRFDLDKETKKSIVNQKFYDAAKYAKEKINVEITRRGIARKDVILCGRSQGAFMSIYLGMTNSEPCHSIISLCGFAREDLDLQFNSRPPIVWLEAGNDTVLNEERKKSYQVLQQEGIQVDYLVDADSDHDNISDKAIENIIDKYN